MNNKPTYETYYPNGNIQSQSWWENGLPAWISYYLNGNIYSQQWYVNGIILSNKEVLQIQYQFFNKIIYDILIKKKLSYGR